MPLGAHNIAAFGGAHHICLLSSYLRGNHGPSEPESTTKKADTQTQEARRIVVFIFLGLGLGFLVFVWSLCPGRPPEGTTKASGRRSTRKLRLGLLIVIRRFRDCVE